MTTMHAPNLTVPSCVLADRCRPGISPCLCRRTSRCAGGRSRSPRPRLCTHTPYGRHCAAHVAPRDRLLFAHDVDSAPCMHGVSPTGSLRRARLVHAGRMANSERRHVEAAWHGVACRKFATTKQAEMIDINFKQLTRIYPVGAATQSPPQSRWRGLLRPTSDRAGGYSSLLSLHCVRLLATNARTPTCAGGCHHRRACARTHRTMTPCRAGLRVRRDALAGDRLVFSRRRSGRFPAPPVWLPHARASLVADCRIRKPSRRTELPDVYDADVGQPREVQGERQLRVRVAGLSRTDRTRRR
jgi:hypothetical protein